VLAHQCFPGGVLAEVLHDDEVEEAREHVGGVLGIAYIATAIWSVGPLGVLRLGLLLVAVGALTAITIEAVLATPW
jgi:hypothetical protein